MPVRVEVLTVADHNGISCRKCDELQRRGSTILRLSDERQGKADICMGCVAKCCTRHVRLLRPTDIHKTITVTRSELLARESRKKRRDLGPYRRRG